MKFLLSILIFSIVLTTSSAQAIMPKAIYGEDDRQEVFNYGDAEFQTIANSVAGVVATSRLRSLDDERMTFFSPTIKSSNNL